MGYSYTAKLPKSRSKAENKLLRKTALGKICQLGDGCCPIKNTSADTSVVIRASIIKFLALGGSKKHPVTPFGIRLKGARITKKLNLENTQIPIEIQLTNCLFYEDINLTSMSSKTLKLTGSQLLRSLIADRVNIDGSFYLDNKFVSTKEVSLIGASISGSLNCQSSIFYNPKGDALSCDRISVKGSVFLDHGFIAFGTVRFLGGDIGSNLDCSTGNFFNDKKRALSCHRLIVRGSVFLNKKFNAEGEVTFVNANIYNNLHCNNGHFHNPKRLAFSCSRIAVNGDVFLNENFRADGEVSFVNAVIGSNFNCQSSIFINPNDYANNKALNCRGLHLHGSLSFNEQTKINGGFSLVDAKIGYLLDAEQSWPNSGCLYIDGCTYNNISAVSALSKPNNRMKWLNLQSDHNLLYNFKPQPFEHLAKTLKQQGHPHHFRLINIAKQKQLRRAKKETFKKKHSMAAKSSPKVLWRKVKHSVWYSWSYILEHTIGYGYAPWRVGNFLGILLLSGLVIFSAANDSSVMIPSDSRIYTSKEYKENNTKLFEKVFPSYPKFNAFVYSLDTLIPLVDLHQEKYWEPSSKVKWGTETRSYLWFQIIAGWLLATLGVAGMTGIVKRD